MKNTIRYLQVLCVGLIIGLVSGIMLNNALNPKSDPNAHISTKTISGAPIIIKEIKTHGTTTSVDTTYSNAGESEIIIPDDAIPAAHAWDTYKWSLGGLYSTDKTISIMGGIRYKQIMFIASPWFRNNSSYSAGMSVGAMYIF